MAAGGFEYLFCARGAEAHAVFGAMAGGAGAAIGSEGLEERAGLVEGPVAAIGFDQAALVMEWKQVGQGCRNNCGGGERRHGARYDCFSGARRKNPHTHAGHFRSSTSG